MLIVVALQPAEVSPRLAYMMQRVMGQVVDQVPANQANPVNDPQVAIIRKYKRVHCVVSNRDENYCQNRREH